VAKLIKHLERAQAIQANPAAHSRCDSCGESPSDVQILQQITSEESDNDNDNDFDKTKKVTRILLNLELGKSSQSETNGVNKETHRTISSSSNSARISQNAEEYLNNVFFSVKSTKRFHKSRLGPVLKTWYKLVRDQTWIFTDDDDPELMEETNGHVVNTHCPSTHYRQALCCKMAAEFDAFIRTTKSWFCHFDDDNYVNIPALLNMLGKYDSRDYWYLGKPSLKSPIRIRDPDNHTEEVSFWFATGGAGFCLSRALALRMSPLASGGKFTKICDRIQLPDDVTVGYIAGHLLGQNLTVIPQFHSHFETMKFIDMKNPSSEITYSYARYPEYENVLDIDGFTKEEDPTRFLSLHCKLFPHFSFCPNNVARLKRSVIGGRISRRKTNR
jgi:fringe protein